MSTELVKMSSKGQLVVPQEIREKEDFKAGDRFVSFPIEDGVVFKRVNMPDLKKEFEELSKQIREKFAQEGVKEEDVEEAIEWARG